MIRPRNPFRWLALKRKRNRYVVPGQKLWVQVEVDHLDSFSDFRVHIPNAVNSATNSGSVWVNRCFDPGNPPPRIRYSRWLPW